MIFKKLFNRKKEKWIPNRIINTWEHNAWGNSIYWSDWEKRKLCGHLTPKPKVDDEIRSEFNNGKIGRFRVINVEHVSGVHDMFWCNVLDIGYVEENELLVKY